MRFQSCVRVCTLFSYRRTFSEFTVRSNLLHEDTYKIKGSVEAWLRSRGWEIQRLHRLGIDSGVILGQAAATRTWCANIGLHHSHWCLRSLFRCDSRHRIHAIRLVPSFKHGNGADVHTRAAYPGFISDRILPSCCFSFVVIKRLTTVGAIEFYVWILQGSVAQLCRHPCEAKSNRSQQRQDLYNRNAR
jgi:hypothetical protein